jgi:hypothetical protein
MKKSVCKDSIDLREVAKDLYDAETLIEVINDNSEYIDKEDKIELEKYGYQITELEKHIRAIADRARKNFNGGQK